MVDLKKAQAGDLVKFRSGGQAIISKVHEGVRGATVKFMDNDWSEFYLYSGHKMGLNVPHLMDITEINPATEVFEWEEAKWGMAFRLSDDSNEIYYFIGKAIDGDPKFRVLCQRKSNGIPAFLNKSYLSRAPEYDLKGDK